MANRSISISLDETLLADLDAQGGNRSALVGEALAFWLEQRRLAALHEAYADLARLGRWRS
jgi:metal-responsive CopG/Arc/MetJ family transcriptional regulator